MLALLALAPYDPASPPFDRCQGAPAWAVAHDPERTPGACADALADYPYDPCSPLPPPPPGPAPTAAPEYIPTAPVFNPGHASRLPPPPPSVPAERSRKRRRAPLILDVLSEDPAHDPAAPNCDLTDDATDHLYGFDMCAFKGGLRFLINSSSPTQALSLDHGPMANVPTTMLESAVRLQSTVFVLSTRAAGGKRRRVFEEL